MSTPTIAILGARGRLGAALARGLAQTHPVHALARPEIDLSNPSQLEKKLSALSFDALINCAALTNVDYCEDHPEEAMRVNADAVGAIARVCASKKAYCIHISTDYVFDGVAPGLRRESDLPRPTGIYAESKLCGEKQLHAINPNFLNVRVSWVFGADKPSFVDMILTKAFKQDHVEAIGDKYSSPTYTGDFVFWTQALLEKRPGATLHLCNSGQCSWSEFGQAALDTATALGLPLKTHRIESIPLASMQNFKAPRPIHTAMNTERFTQITGITPRPWQSALEDYLQAHYAAR